VLWRREGDCGGKIHAVAQQLRGGSRARIERRIKE